MTVVLDLHPDAGHPAWAGLVELHAVLDLLCDHATAGEPLASGDYAHLVREADRAISRMQAVKLGLVAAADRAQVARGAGIRGTGAWLSKQTRVTGAVAAGQVALAGALESLPATGAALREGGVSAEHVAVIAAAAKQLPVTLDETQRAAVEERLVEQAKTLDPAALRKKAHRALDTITSREEADRHHDQVLHDEESRARARTRLTLHDNTDGTLTGHFTVPTLAGAILRKILQQMTSPRRGRLGATDAQAGPCGEAIDWPQRHGLAFVELIEHLPTDRLHGKTAATIVVTLDHTQLTADLAAAGLDTGDQITAAEARRLACGAGILPAVLNGASLPLDLGRTQRFFTEAQRVALAIRHTTCAADGCDVPYAWTNLHHRDPWALGGPTDLTNAVPLCGFHHHRTHDPTYHHRHHPDGRVTYHLRR